MILTKYRSEVYLLLAESFKMPTPAFVLGQSEILDILVQTFDELDYDIPVRHFLEWPALTRDLKKLEQEYKECFLSPNNPEARLLPLESVYRLEPRQRAAYKRGIPVNLDIVSLDDHISVQLEHADFLLRQGDFEGLSSYLQSHLDWVTEMELEAEKLALPKFYRQVIEVANKFITCEIECQRAKD